MVVPLLDEPADAAGLIEELRQARGRPEGALRRALPFAAAIAPAVIGLVEKAADGNVLTPGQSNLLFWGLPILAAGRRTELCRPFLRFIGSADDETLDEYLGDGVTEIVGRVVISMFDGDADALLTLVADEKVNEYVRWGLFSALTRLTFDGAVARDAALQVLERFEVESLAEPGAVCWQGWAEAVVYLSFDNLHDRLRKAYGDGRIPDEIMRLDEWEQQIAVVGAMRPGDPGLLEREEMAPLTDPADFLRWMPSAAEVEKRERLRDDDPAAGLIRSFERHWLDDFLSSKHAPITAMTIAGVDGYFTALAVCPQDVGIEEYWPALWNHDDETETEAEPDYGDDEQAEYVVDLFGRYLEAVKRRVAKGHPHPGNYVPSLGFDEDQDERLWAAGFIRGVALRAELWGDRVRDDDNFSQFMNAIYTLAVDDDPSAETHFTPQQRTAFFNKLPKILHNLYRTWRGRSALQMPAITAPIHYDPATARPFGRKVGRNEPCPCGSGKKYKRCCGGIAAAS